MIRMYGRYWWAFVIRGILAFLFGIAAFVLPGITLHVLVLMFAAFLMVDGAFSFTASLVGRNLDNRWWLLLLEGGVGLVIGALAIIWPGLTVLALIAFIGLWALVTGSLQLVAAFRLRHELESHWLLGASGSISILFGIMLFGGPATGVVVSGWLIGLYAIAFGLALIFLGIKLRKSNVIITIRKDE